MVSVTELVLGSNENIDNVQRLQWNVEEGEWVELGVCMFVYMSVIEVIPLSF